MSWHCEHLLATHGGPSMSSSFSRGQVRARRSTIPLLVFNDTRQMAQSYFSKATSFEKAVVYVSHSRW
eukprot:5691386-Pleurochrysis_carterae.AAC.1